MIGAIIGDIAGSIYEFNNVKSEDFPLMQKQSTFTDDTICTIAIADAAMNGWTFKNALVDWCGRYPFPMGGYGAAFNNWLNSYPRYPYNSFGNGAAMRVSSLGWLFETTAEVLSAAEASASCTHDHLQGLMGASATAVGVFQLRRGYTKNDFRKFIEGIYGKLPEYKPFSNPFNETCQGTIPVAASCLLASDNFEDAIRKAIMVGGDSDTIAAIVGGWAEAMYGIPSWLKQSARKKLTHEMLEVIDQFNQEMMNRGVRI